MLPICFTDILTPRAQCFELVQFYEIKYVIQTLQNNAIINQTKRWITIENACKYRQFQDFTANSKAPKTNLLEKHKFQLLQESLSETRQLDKPLLNIVACYPDLLTIVMNVETPIPAIAYDDIYKFLSLFFCPIR
jgi:hypothetical protein